PIFTQYALGSPDLVFQGGAIAPDGSVWVSNNGTEVGTISSMTFTPRLPTQHFVRSIAFGGPTGNDLYLSDTGSHVLFQVVNGTNQLVAGMVDNPAPGGCGNGGPAKTTQLGFVTAMAVDAAGDIAFTDQSHCVFLYRKSTDQIEHIGGTGAQGTGPDNAV